MNQTWKMLAGAARNYNRFGKTAARRMNWVFVTYLPPIVDLTFWKIIFSELEGAL